MHAQADEFRLGKRLVIQHGFDGIAPPPQPTGLVYLRADFVNEYWRRPPKSAGSTSNITNTTSDNSNV